MNLRKLHKAISILCAALLIVSLGAIALNGVTSAFRVGDTPTGSTVRLTFDNNTGVSGFYDAAMKYNGYTSDPENGSNRVVFVNSSMGTSRSIEIGKDDSATADRLATNAFSMQSGEQYVISFDYKVKAGSYSANNIIQLRLLRGKMIDYADSKGNVITPGKTVLATDFSNFKITAENGTLMSDGKVYKLDSDSKWLHAEVTVTAPANMNGADHLYLQVNSNANCDETVYFDNFYIDRVGDNGEDLNNEFVFDFKSADGTKWNPLDHKVFAHSSEDKGKLSFVADDGAHFTTKADVKPDTNTGWRQLLAVYDADNGGYFKFLKDTTYAVTVKYKLSTLSSKSASLAVSATTAESQDKHKAPGEKGAWHTVCCIGWTDNLTAVNSEWQYYTAIFNSTDKGVADGWLYLTASGSDNQPNTFTVESVTVKEVRYKDGVGAVRFESNGGDYAAPVLGKIGSKVILPSGIKNGDKALAGWYTDPECKTGYVGYEYQLTSTGTTLYARWSSSVITATKNNSGIVTKETCAAGTVIPRPTRPERSMFFEGWYTDLTFKNKITEYPDQDIYLYAKYNATFLGFNESGVTDSSNNAYSIIADPDDPSNSCIKFSSPKGSTNNIELGMYDATGSKAFRLKAKTTYTISAKVKVLPGMKGGELKLMQGSQSAYNPTRPKLVISGFNYSWNNVTGESGTDWVTVTGSFTTGATLYTDEIYYISADKLYLGLSGLPDGGSANDVPASVLIDDVLISELSDTIPEGAVAIFFENNFGKVNTIYGYPGEELILPVPDKVTARRFVGWFTDKQLYNQYTETVFGNESITLYAKWQSEDWICDFENFNASLLGKAFELVTENGNTYMKYRGDNKTADSRTVFNNAGVSFAGYHGNKYIVEFDYRLKSSDSTFKALFMQSASGNAWVTATSVEEITGRLSGGSAWQKASISMTAKANTNNLSFFNISVKGAAELDIDNVVFKTVSDHSSNYGSTSVVFETGCDINADPAFGDPGDTFRFPELTKAGCTFAGWYEDASYMTPCSSSEFDKNPKTLYAKWFIGNVNEGFENLPSDIVKFLATCYSFNTPDSPTYKAEGIRSGSTSIFRDGTQTVTRSFALCRDTSSMLKQGGQYTLTFYVKPTNVTDSAGTISLAGVSVNTRLTKPNTTEKIIDYGNLKVGEWNRITYTFTAKDNYIGLMTVGGADMYFDDFNVALTGYTGSSTGDSSVPAAVFITLAFAAAAVFVINSIISHSYPCCKGKNGAAYENII